MTGTLPPLREVIAELGLSANKALGQNFLMDLNLTGKIARQVPDIQSSLVVEIGPGPGGLTRGLLAEGAAHVLVIEKDQRFLPALESIKKHYPDRLTIRHGDALHGGEQNIINQLGWQGPVQIASNLPYNVGTALFTRWMSYTDWPPFYQSLTLLFQKEVAERITAQPDNKSYGRLAVLANWRAKSQKLFDIPANAFTPPPKVTSTLIQITPGHPINPEVMPDTLAMVTEAAFGQRRKMLRRSLKNLHVDTEALLETANIAPERRAETLSVEEFCTLTRVYQSMIAG